MILLLFGQAQGQGNPIMGLLPLILIFVVFYFLLILPQQRKQKKHRKLISELQKGDRVTTSSGIRGTIANVKDDTITLLIADGVKIELEKGHIVNKLNTSGS
ncbi:MAG: preprotein translocase subunit YajC [candidate division WOR-3 bacterium]|nr:MAG: preprotein translocase subunit YajC [candidate division WOR-3 bacterium]